MWRSGAVEKELLNIQGKTPKSWSVRKLGGQGFQLHIPLRREWNEMSQMRWAHDDRAALYGRQSSFLCSLFELRVLV